jgi:hypothetical protein
MERLKVVILCGGKGTPYPFTEYFPKVMMPVNGADPRASHAHVRLAGSRTSCWPAATIEMLRLLQRALLGVEREDRRHRQRRHGRRIFRCGSFVGERFFATYGDRLGDPTCTSWPSTASGPATTPCRCAAVWLVVFDDAGKVQRFEESPSCATTGSTRAFCLREVRLEDGTATTSSRTCCPISRARHPA